MNPGTRLFIGLGLVVVGLLWTAQGIGWVGGSFMSGELAWAIIGPVVVMAGIMVARGARSGG